MDEAYKHAMLSVKLGPDLPDGHLTLGNVLVTMHKIPDAIKQYQIAAESAPKSADILNNLGTAMAMDGQMDAAIEQFQAALKIDPNHPNAKKNLQECLDLRKKGEVPKGLTPGTPGATKP
jgi:tetratricopeptide (TPR) repeat protein